MNKKTKPNGKEKICEALCELGKDKPIERITV